MTALANFMTCWKHPKALSNHVDVKGVFSKDRLKSSLSDQRLKCSASEGLCIYPIIAQWCSDMVDNAAIRPYCRCFLFLAHVLGLWQRGVRKLSTAVALKNAIVRFLREYRVIYGDALMVIKFHYILHIPLQFDALINCWVHERKHKHVKKFANEISNTSSDWDRSVLREISLARLWRLESMPHDQFCAGVNLKFPKSPSKRLQDAFKATLKLPADTVFSTSEVVQVDNYGEHIHVGDVALYRKIADGAAAPGISVGKIEWHASFTHADELSVVSCLEEFDICEDKSRCLKCRATGRHVVEPSHALIAAAIWAGEDGGVLTVLKPLHALQYDSI